MKRKPLISKTWLLLNDETIEVEVSGEMYYDSGEFDYAGTHCTHGRPGTYKPLGGGSYNLDGEISWDKTKFTEEENKVIENHIEDNFDDIKCDLEEGRNIE